MLSTERSGCLVAGTENGHSVIKKARIQNAKLF